MSPFQVKLPRRDAPATAVKPARPTARPAAKPASAPARENRLVRWYRETESELRKVVWPSRKEWANLTMIVVATTVVAGVFLGVLDFLFERLILLIR